MVLAATCTNVWSEKAALQRRCFPDRPLWAERVSLATMVHLPLPHLQTAALSAQQTPYLRQWASFA